MQRFSDPSRLTSQCALRNAVLHTRLNGHYAQGLPSLVNASQSSTICVMINYVAVIYGTGLKICTSTGKRYSAALVKGIVSDEWDDPIHDFGYIYAKPSTSLPEHQQVMCNVFFVYGRGTTLCHDNDVTFWITIIAGSWGNKRHVTRCNVDMQHCDKISITHVDLTCLWQRHTSRRPTYQDQVLIPSSTLRQIKFTGTNV